MDTGVEHAVVDDGVAAVAGGEQHPQAGLDLRHPPREAAGRYVALAGGAKALLDCGALDGVTRSPGMAVAEFEFSQTRWLKRGDSS